MVALNFPNSPTVGDTYPNPPQTGIPTYQWNGTEWLATFTVAHDVIFPAGTVMLFYMGSAPLGWTKLTTDNDKAIRVVSGTGGVAGGSNAFSTVMAQSAVGNHTNTLAETPAITSSATNGITVYPGGFGSGNQLPVTTTAAWAGVPVNGDAGGYVAPHCTVPGVVGSTTFCSNNQTISVNSVSTTGGAHNHTITLGLAYLDVIVASKN